MNTTITPTRFTLTRSAFAVGLLAMMSLAPAHAGICDLFDGDPNTEDDGGSSAGNNSIACGHQVFAGSSNTVAIGSSFDVNGNGIFDIDLDFNGDNIPDTSSEFLQANNANAVAIGSASGRSGICR